MQKMRRGRFGEGPCVPLCLWERRGAGGLRLTPTSPRPTALRDSCWSLVPEVGGGGAGVTLWGEVWEQREALVP